jgi:4-hydroxybenzoate polyprenyltransferase
MVRALWRLIHPGPTLLVTACFAGIAAAGRPPDPGVVVRCALAMLGIQVCIGALNDICDRRADAGRQDKPLVVGSLTVRHAETVIVIGFTTALAMAAALPPLAGLLLLAGLSAGIAYDVGLKRSAWSWLAWWVGFAALPLGARAAAGSLEPDVLLAVPLCAGLALTVHVANAAGDIAVDSGAGVATIAVRLGRERSLMVIALSGLSTALLAPLCALAGFDVVPLIAGAAILAAAVLIVSAVRPRRPFPLIAAGAAALAVAWTLALPR